jgi:hypothetical protein
VYIKLDIYVFSLLGQVSLSVVWRVLGEYWMSVFGKVSFGGCMGGVGGGLGFCFWDGFFWDTQIQYSHNTRHKTLNGI